MSVIDLAYLRDPEHEKRLTSHFNNLQSVCMPFRLTAGSAVDLIAMMTIDDRRKKRKVTRPISLV